MPSMQVTRQRRVVCAAIRAEDGAVLLGARHYDLVMHHQIEQQVVPRKWYHRNGDDQGFIDQRGVYMTRAEAYLVAEAAGQILYPDACRQRADGWHLYSEGLY